MGFGMISHSDQNDQVQSVYHNNSLVLQFESISKNQARALATRRSEVRNDEIRKKGLINDTYDYQSLPSPKRQDHYQTPQTPHVTSTDLALTDMRIVRCKEIRYSMNRKRELLN